MQDPAMNGNNALLPEAQEGSDLYSAITSTDEENVKSTSAIIDHAYTNVAGTERSRPKVSRAETAPAHRSLSTVLSRSGTNGTAGTRQRQRVSTTKTPWRESTSRWDQPFPYQFQTLADSDSDLSSDDDDRSLEAKAPQRPAAQSQASETSSDSSRPHAHRMLSEFRIGNEHFRTKGKISKKDGRLTISIKEAAHSGYIAKAFGQSISNHLGIPHCHGPQAHQDAVREQRSKLQQEVDEYLDLLRKTAPHPRLNIVVMVIGSRGDIQPFLKIGKILRDRGHRVRIATHPAFKDFVQNQIGLEFFSIGGDPSELMAFMVKNPGLIPSLETVKKGEIQKRRADMGRMFEGFWRACINDDQDQTDPADGRSEKEPFIAHAIIANPPSFAHVHIAERLGIPLHLMFTFPYSPTQQFPHPLANVKVEKSNVDANYINFMSYPLVEMMTWQGLGDIVNHFRVKTLGLEPVSALWAPGATYRMKVPYTYMWSEELVPKPKDWGPEIDVSGYVFLDLGSHFKPPQSLLEFLDAGEPPVYIGFGSIVVDNPDRFTKMIFEATKKAGVRALVSKGWGGFGAGATPDNIYMLENTPHDWLFPRCSAVVHHGGAGTTAAGFKAGKPTLIVPFFGDQAFWGMQVYKNKAGAQAIPHKKLTTERLAEGIKQCLTEEANENAQRIAETIAKEGDGAENAVNSFERKLPLVGSHNMRCSIFEDRVAVWSLKHTYLRLSPLAAEILVTDRKLKWEDLRLLHYYEWNDFDGPGEPISGVAGAMAHSAHTMAKGVGMVPVRWERHMRKRAEHERKRSVVLASKAARAQQTAPSSDSVLTLKEQLLNRSPIPNISAGPERVYTTGSTNPDTSLALYPTLSADPEHGLAEELAEDTAHGLWTTSEALMEMPLDLGVAIAQGFHNAPRLYGDATVRKPIRITGFKSGARAAGNEFVFGIYDGVTGLVTQPYHGWQDGIGPGGHLAGLGSGFAKGVGGFVLKDISAFVTPLAFLGQGLRKEIKKHAAGPAIGTDKWIRKAQMLQGQRDLEALVRSGEGEAESARQKVSTGWQTLQEVWSMASGIKRAGRFFTGRRMLRKERDKWKGVGVMDNVKSVQAMLDARKEGIDVDEYVKRHKRVATELYKQKSEASQPNSSLNPSRVGTNEKSSPPSNLPAYQRSGMETTMTNGSKSTVVATPTTSEKVPQGPEVIHEGATNVA